MALLFVFGSPPRSVPLALLFLLSLRIPSSARSDVAPAPRWQQAPRSWCWWCLGPALSCVIVIVGGLGQALGEAPVHACGLPSLFLRCSIIVLIFFFFGCAGCGLPSARRARCRTLSPHAVDGVLAHVGPKAGRAFGAGACRARAHRADGRRRGRTHVAALLRLAPASHVGVRVARRRGVPHARSDVRDAHDNTRGTHHRAADAGGTR